MSEIFIYDLFILLRKKNEWNGKRLNFFEGLWWWQLETVEGGRGVSVALSLAIRRQQPPRGTHGENGTHPFPRPSCCWSHFDLCSDLE